MDKWLSQGETYFYSDRLSYLIDLFLIYCLEKESTFLGSRPINIGRVCRKKNKPPCLPERGENSSNTLCPSTISLASGPFFIHLCGRSFPRAIFLSPLEPLLSPSSIWDPSYFTELELKDINSDNCSLTQRWWILGVRAFGFHITWLEAIKEAIPETLAIFPWPWVRFLLHHSKK